jgi:hypothetical protein
MIGCMDGEHALIASGSLARSLPYPVGHAECHTIDAGGGGKLVPDDK